MKRTVLCGHTGSYNRGCEAIVRSTLDLLQRNQITADIATFAPDQDIKAGLDNLISYRNNNNSSGKFYWMAGRSVLFVGVATAFGFLMKTLYQPVGWLDLIVCGVVMCLLTVLVVFLLFFSKEEKGDFLKLLRIKRR